jgi:hypothetical protein
MPELITPTKVTVITKDGECQIHITLDINVNLNGISGVSSPQIKDKIKEEEEKTIWAIPEFKAQEKVKFGKKE